MIPITKSFQLLHIHVNQRRRVFHVEKDTGSQTVYVDASPRIVCAQFYPGMSA